MEARVIRKVKPYVLPKLQPHVLKRIRLKVKRENRKFLVKKLIIAAIILLAITYWISQL